MNKFVGFVGFVGLFLVLFSCNDAPLTENEIKKRIKNRDFSIYENLPTCSCNDLEQKVDGYYKNDSLYTGTCFLNYPNIDAKYEVRQIYKGKLNGKRIILSPKGDTITQNEYKEGKVIRKDVGKKEICDCDELKKIERADGSTIAKYYNEPFTGICRRYFPAPNEDQVYLETTYKDGVIHGRTKIYDKNGDLILTEHYVNGEKQ